MKEPFLRAACLAASGLGPYEAMRDVGGGHGTVNHLSVAKAFNEHLGACVHTFDWTPETLANAFVAAAHDAAAIERARRGQW